VYELGGETIRLDGLRLSAPPDMAIKNSLDTPVTVSVPIARTTT
jgi:hypothetical protein